MRMIDTVIKPMHPEGYKFVAAFAAVTLILFWIWEPLIVSPADGVVSLIERAVPPAELGMGPEALVRVSVFMSVFNCHVNRAPIAGRVAAVAYRPGKFFNASLDKASEERRQRAGHRAGRWPQDRRGADRGAGRAAHRLLEGTGRHAAHG